MAEEEKPKEKGNIFLHIYEFHYKKLVIFPMFLLLLSFIIIGANYVRTGDVIGRDISLKGGTTVTITTSNQIDALDFENFLSSAFPKSELSIRILSDSGRQIGFIVETDIQDQDTINNLLSTIQEKTGALNKDQYSIQTIGSNLGGSFYREALVAVVIAFIFMGIVVLIYFRNLVPSLFVILCGFADIVMPFAVLVLFGVKLSTAGIAAFLMLIGYSIDTDILLTTRVLKGKEGTVFDRTVGAVKTGLAMTMSALAVALVAYFFAQSETIKQIMLILSIGLVFDIFNTWITNVTILRWYLERKHKHHETASHQ